MIIWVVEIAEYMGDGYWADYAPLEFDSEQEARDYAELINANRQVGGKQKVRSIHFKSDLTEARN